jgi:hypothetical protein
MEYVTVIQNVSTKLAAYLDSAGSRHAATIPMRASDASHYTSTTGARRSKAWSRMTTACIVCVASVFLHSPKQSD